MYITKSNVLIGSVPTITTGENFSFDPASISDPDFSTFYISSSNSSLVASFGSVSSINYVAIAGVNIEGNKDFTSSVSVQDGSAFIATTFISMNNCVLITFTTRSFTDLRVNIFNGAASTPPRVAFIAAGDAFEVPNNGEVSGYNRQFLNRNIKTRSTLSNIAAPVSALTKKVGAKGKLSLPDMTKDFTESTWQDFLTFSSNNQFFIREQDPGFTVTAKGETTSNNSAYLCFDLSSNKVSAHSKTRELNNITCSFAVFNGL